VSGKNVHEEALEEQDDGSKRSIAKSRSDTYYS
jgi:hypothetical protein